MALTPGSRLGPYEIVAPIGAGGMGEVYRATDSNLKRSVAIKVLPASVAGDADRLARFQREAEVLGALNHPNISAIYGLERTPDFTALVMELVEGEDLSQRIGRGAIPIDEALPIAKQIADALEAAHEQGIIHRDLKPANIKVRADGTVKVLDFGLAKAMEPAAGASTSMSISPTITTPAMTQAGMILGTAAYMSPEQAKGRTADKRSDVWSFGCVLYEMLTAKRAFGGEDLTDTIAAVVRGEPEWSALPPDVPDQLALLLKRCLEKDRRLRVSDMGVARFVMTQSITSASGPAPRPGVSASRPFWYRALRTAGLAVLFGVLVSVVTWLAVRPPPSSSAVTRFTLPVPDDHQFARTADRLLAVSPDGSQLVYRANQQIYIRRMAETETRAVPGTRGLDPANAFFSPDGQWIGFESYRDSTLKKIGVNGGTPVTLCKIGTAWGGASWDGDQIVFAEPGKGILRVSANGGEPEVIVRTSPSEVPYGPQLLNGGKDLLFSTTTSTGAQRWDQGQVVVQSLRSSERTVLVRGGSDGRYVATGHLVYATAGTVVAVPFDVRTLHVVGGPVPIINGVLRADAFTGSGAANMAFAANGSLFYIPGPVSGGFPPTVVALADKSGRLQPLGLPPLPYIHPRISPDGKKLAVSSDDGKDAAVWVYDLAGSNPPRRLTFEGRNQFPIWTPDNKYVTFQSDRDGDAAIFRQLADGSGPVERLTKPERGSTHEPESWSPDGRTLSFNLVQSNDQGVWTMSLEGDRKPVRFADDPMAVEKHSVFSPDGRWLAYMSNANATTTEVFVQPFPPTGAKYLVSADGGRTPVWSSDGQQLFYHQTQPNRILVVDVRTGAGSGFSVGPPAPLPIEGTVHPIQQRNYDVLPDGKQFVVVLPAATDRVATAGYGSRAQINVVLNWFDELKRVAPAK